MNRRPDVPATTVPADVVGVAPVLHDAGRTQATASATATDSHG